MFKIGIDLATRINGISILDSKNRLIETGTYNLGGVKESNIENIIYILEENIKRLINVLQGQNIKQEETVYLIFEVSNHGNSEINQKFSRVLGITETLLQKGLDFLKLDIVKKITNANGWFYGFAKKGGLGPNWNKLDRQKRKELSVFKAMEETDVALDDDQADSFGIAYFAERVETTEFKSLYIDLKKRLRSNEGNS